MAADTMVGRGESVAVQVPIERQVFEGQTADGGRSSRTRSGSKGARLSTQISIAGAGLLVFLPQDTHIGIFAERSARPRPRDALRGRMQQLTATTDGSAPGGFILRTNAEDASDDELADDIAYLRKAWAAIRAKGLAQPPGTLLHEDLNLAERVLR